MSDQLTVSAALSVLMMAVYVLFGADTGSAAIDLPTLSLSAPALTLARF